MRYEAKHNYLKKMAQNVGNYINISWTLAMRHQYLQCYYSISGDNLFDACTEIGPGMQCTFNGHLCYHNTILGDTVATRNRPLELMEETNECYRLVVDLLSYEVYAFMNRPNWVKVDSVTYQKPSALLVGYTNDYPLFGRLEDIYIVNSMILFNVTLLQTLTFNDHLQAYVVQQSSDSSVIPHTQLLNPFPMHIHRVNSSANDSEAQSVIVCKYNICNVLL